MSNRRVLVYNGETFEFDIMHKLKTLFPEAVFLHNLTLYSHYLRKDTQIDLIAVTSTGVFVIEAKNWKGWLSGEYNDHQWTGKSRDNKILTVFNPLHQNFIHIRELRNAIRNSGSKPDYFYNLVVVPDGTAIKSSCKEVLNLSRLPLFISECSKDCIDIEKCVASIKAVTR